MVRPSRCRCKPGILTCWTCVTDRQWEQRWKARGYAEAERRYYAARRDPLEMRAGARHWRDQGEDERNEVPANQVVPDVA